jgi:hypothetical protein
MPQTVIAIRLDGSFIEFGRRLPEESYQNKGREALTFDQETFCGGLSPRVFDDRL